MQDYRFTYTMKLDFDIYIEQHSFAIRCKPFYSKHQRYDRLRVDIEPSCSTWESRDAFGNNVISGYCRPLHNKFNVRMSGIAEINSLKPIMDKPMVCYRYPSSLTKPGKQTAGIARMIDPSKDFHELVVSMSETVNQKIVYQKDMTKCDTTAETALDGGYGVCQDYAHIMLTVARLLKIPCRYVSGIMDGEGHSHAWIELHDGRQWVGYDPTHHCFTDERYLKLSHGRDANDCLINRGTFLGIAGQTMKINAAMTAIADIMRG